MAWIITKDRLFEKDPNDWKSSVGVRSRKWDEVAPNNNPTHRFRMLDDDGEVYYEGKSTVADSFAPLDDFGMPDSGCTEIQYYNNGLKQWERL